MTGRSSLVFLVDADNTLLDNDRIQDDLDRYIAATFDGDAAKTYWAIFEDLRERSGYADYLAAIQKFRLECGDEVRAQHLAGFLLDYPFAERIYPRALEAIAHVSQLGLCVVLSDGDAVMQPRKVGKSGIADAVDGRVLIYVHKEHMLKDVSGRFPADHYVMIDDKLRVLADMKQAWRARLTTVFVRQGHYANDAAARRAYPPAQFELDAIGALCTLDTRDFLSPTGNCHGGQT
jgi:FMN phosphatase YigB (HAD superfamily)